MGEALDALFGPLRKHKGLKAICQIKEDDRNVGCGCLVQIKNSELSKYCIISSSEVILPENLPEYHVLFERVSNSDSPRDFRLKDIIKGNTILGSGLILIFIDEISSQLHRCGCIWRRKCSILKHLPEISSPDTNRKTFCYIGGKCYDYNHETNEIVSLDDSGSVPNGCVLFERGPHNQKIQVVGIINCFNSGEEKNSPIWLTSSLEEIIRVDEEDRKRKEEQDRKKEEEEDRKRKQEEDRKKKEEDRQRKELEDKKEEEDRKRKEEEDRKKEEEDRKRKELEDKKEEEDRKRKEEEGRKKEEEDRKRKEEQDRKKEEEDRKRKEEEGRKKEEEDRKRKEEEGRKKEEEDRKRKEEQDRKKEEEDRKRKEEQDRRKEEEHRKEEQKDMKKEHQIFGPPAEGGPDVTTLSSAQSLNSEEATENIQIRMQNLSLSERNATSETKQKMADDVVDAGVNQNGSQVNARLSASVKGIPLSVYGPLCLMLNVKRDVKYDDFRMLAEKVGLNRDETYFIEQLKNPTDEILKTWSTKNEATVGTLIDILKGEHLERMDAVKLLEDWVNQK